MAEIYWDILDRDDNLMEVTCPRCEGTAIVTIEWLISRHFTRRSCTYCFTCPMLTDEALDRVPKHMGAPAPPATKIPAKPVLKSGTAAPRSKPNAFVAKAKKPNPFLNKGK